MSAARSPQESTDGSPSPPEEPVTGVPAEDDSAAAGEHDRSGGGSDRTAKDVTAPAGPVRRVRDVADPSRVRRAPRYGRFALAGVVLAALVSFGLTFVPGAEEGLTRRNLFLLLLLSLGCLGILLGVLAAMWSDRRSLRRRR